MGKLTAMQEIENFIIDFEKEYGTPTMFEIKEQIEILKEKEKQQIIDAADWIDFENSPYESAEDYYNKTFKK